MLRARAVNAREHGIKLREKMLGDPDRAGRIGGIAPALSNWACRSPFQRRMMEKMVGIHRDKKLPEFAGETFEKWLRRTGLPPEPAEPNAKVALFHTCFVNYYNTAPGKALVSVLAKNGCAVASPDRIVAGCPRSTAAMSSSRANRRARILLRYCRWCARDIASPRSTQPAP